MTSAPHPLIIYVPGLLPKPEPGIHRDALLRCLLTGIRRLDEAVAAEIEGNSTSFDIVSWTYDFYREHRDFGIDAAAVDDLIEQEVASPEDVAEATSWRRQLTRWIYALGDLLPFLIPHVASERMEVHLRDLRRYLRDDNGIATHTRRMLKMRLRAAAEGRHPTLLIGHSMGSVIAYDTLWELSESGRDRLQLDMLLTMGSPLGNRYMQKRLKGADETGYARYPANIRRWRNLSAVGDMTALDPYLADDFEEMLELGILEDFEDEVIHTHFRLGGVLNVHAEYGYLVNPRTAHTVIDWWRQHSA
ncbi:MAG: hypothetical protein KJP17_01930 [Gammaproteobacteria bacterium]|nr:hypothetical protein [Gammaproteobacteria bacterium]